MKNWKIHLLLPCFCLMMQLVKAQDSTKVNISFYGEPYYSYDFSRPNNHTRPPFIYSHNRTGEVTINLALAHASYTSDRMRARLGLMAGTYSNANLAAEAGVLKNLYEANAGVKISRKRDLWVDAGVLPSHIGFESAIGKDCWTLTRSIAADNSPYYEAGVRLSYNSPNQKWYAAVLALNGWQRIQRVDGNHTPALGTQLTYKPSEKVLINSSTFIGSDYPDSLRKMRYFHNLYSIIQINERLGITAGFDMGMEQKEKGGPSMNYWYTPVFILRTSMAPNKFVAIRIEHYKDKGGVIIGKVNGNWFDAWGYSANFDWALTHNLLWRVETRWLRNEHPYFESDNNSFKKTNASATTAFCFNF